jgi:hypothetical protein
MLLFCDTYLTPKMLDYVIGMLNELGITCLVFYGFHHIGFIGSCPESANRTMIDLFL